MTRALATGLLLTTAVALLGCASEPLSEPSPQGAPVGAESPDPGAAATDDYVLTEYPPGPYGFSQGSVIANLEFKGWHDPVAAGYDPANFETVRLSDFYDPSGETTKLILNNASAVWCSVCRAEYQHMRDVGIYATYKPKGVQLIGALFEDNNAGPATPQDLTEWGSLPAFSVEFPMVLDPGFKLGRYFTSDSTPLNLLIDARTMTIIDATMGYDPSPTSTYWQFVEAWL